MYNVLQWAAKKKKKKKVPSPSQVAGYTLASRPWSMHWLRICRKNSKRSSCHRAVIAYQSPKTGKRCVENGRPHLSPSMNKSKTLRIKACLDEWAMPQSRTGVENWPLQSSIFSCSCPNAAERSLWIQGVTYFIKPFLGWRCSGSRSPYV